MKQVIYRKSKMFVIDEEQLKPAGRKNEIYNALYAAIYTEFQGASRNPNYGHMTNLEKLEQVNLFANNWLQVRGLI